MAKELLDVVPRATIFSEGSCVRMTAVVCGKKDAIPWMSLVIGELPYAITAGTVALEDREGSGSTTRAPEKVMPYGASTPLRDVVSSCASHGSAAMRRLPPP